MAKKAKKSSKKPSLKVFTLATFMPMEPPLHPHDEQEDPINGKYEKTLEVTPWGVDWR